jgi:serine phosphatase RsbU (regulator of sigma subunit)/pSer/pThr/pTyr-binding forkhead associated (FHA) protein
MFKGSLIALDGKLCGRRICFDQQCLIGRAPSNHFVLEDGRVSRQHAHISTEGPNYVLYDLNSVNGTYVNGDPINRCVLRPGDIVSFGGLSFRFEPETAEDGYSLKTRELDPTAQVRIDSGEVTPMGPRSARAPEAPGDADRKLRKLSTSLQSLPSVNGAGDLLDRVARDVLDIFPATLTVAIYLRSPDSDKMTLHVTRSRVQSEHTPIVALELKDWTGRHPVYLLDRGQCMRVPISFGRSVDGALEVRAGNASFSAADVELLHGLAVQTAMALENIRMHSVTRGHERLQQDLALAEQIQKSLLPRELPRAKGYKFAVEYRPAYTVGGDFYDVFWLSERKLGMFVADVSGKGIPAALLMARISSDLRAAAAAHSDPAEVLAQVNRAVLARKQFDTFVTVVYLTLDTQTRQLVLANAGHEPPLLRHGDGEVERLAGTGSALGIFEDARYRSHALSLHPRDALVLCTDGIVEAMDAKGEQFGFERLTRAVEPGSGRAEDLAARVVRELRQHVGKAPAYDDLTLLVCSTVDGEEEAAVPRRPRGDTDSQTIALT